MSIKVPARGNPKARIMLVGEAPGEREERLGKPFVGPAGNLLTEILLKAGIDPDECYYTNLCKYRPPENDLSAWIPKGVPNEQVTDGLLELSQEIDLVQPNVIVPLGNWPLHFTYGQRLNREGQPTGILDYRGYILESRRLGKGRKLAPTVHPSYYLRGKLGEGDLAVFDFAKIRRESLFPEIRRRERVTYCNPTGVLRESLRRRLLAEGPWLCVDIEYIGTSLKCVGFAVSPDWAMTVRIDSPDDLAWCKSLIESGKPLLAQNAMFDFGILDWHYGIRGFDYLAFDTMVAEYNLNIEYKKDLGALGARYTDLPAWWDAISWDDIKAGRQSIDDLLPYNCFDNMATVEVATKQLPDLRADARVWEAFQFDMKKIPALWEIARRGVRLGLDAQEKLRAQVEADREIYQGALNEIVDSLEVIDRRGKDFNVHGKSSVPELLALLGAKMTKRTAGGKLLATDNVTLMELMRKTEKKMLRRVIALILNTRECRDLQSNTIATEWDDDGRARCIYDGTKTVTRRLASKVFFPTGRGTNLQNRPAPGSSTYGAAVRRTFVSDPGYEFGYADLKGAEFLVVAQLTQDPLMLKYAEMTMLGTGDIHKETASYIFGKPISEIAKDSPERFLGKKMRHSGNYMVGWMELMGRINAEALTTGVWVDAPTVKKLIQGYLGMHPMLPAWWDETAAEARKNNGKLRNLFGFPRIFHGSRSEILPEMVAFVPQSTIGDALNMGLLACHNDPLLKMLGFEILLQVHDAIGFQYPEAVRPEVLPRVRQLLDIPIHIPKTGGVLHIPVEIQIGPSWGDLKEWKE